MSVRPTRQQEKVMVVDDDLVVLEITRERLEGAGYEVITRESALGTTAAVLRERPDYLLLDVNMPGLQGDALARLLAGSDPANRPGIILFSSSRRERLLELARECGAMGVVEKTSDAQAFVRQFKACVSPRSIRPAGPG